MRAEFTCNESGSIEFAGPPKGAFYLEILRDWSGLEEEKLEGLKEKGVILMPGSYNW